MNIHGMENVGETFKELFPEGSFQYPEDVFLDTPDGLYVTSYGYSMFISLISNRKDIRTVVTGNKGQTHLEVLVLFNATREHLETKHGRGILNDRIVLTMALLKHGKHVSLR